MIKKKITEYITPTEMSEGGHKNSSALPVLKYIPSKRINWEAIPRNKGCGFAWWEGVG